MASLSESSNAKDSGKKKISFLQELSNTNRNHYEDLGARESGGEASKSNAKIVATNV